MIKHLSPRSEEEIKAIKDKEYLRNRKGWSKAIQLAHKKHIKDRRRYSDIKQYSQIRSIRYNVAKERLKVVFFDKSVKIILYNENITKWLNEIFIKYDDRNVRNN